MTAAQYKRANTTILPILVIIMGYVCFAMFGQIAAYGFQWQHLTQVIVSAIAIIIAVGIYVTNREKKLCSIIMLAAASLAYVVIVLCSDNIECYAYAFPILFSAMALLNVRFVIAGDTIIIASNVIKLAMRLLLL